jgi:hypothetical protein
MRLNTANMLAMYINVLGCKIEEQLRVEMKASIDEDFHFEPVQMALSCYSFLFIYFK